VVIYSEDKIKEPLNDRNSLIYLLLMFIISASLPFRCVNNIYFIKFCKALKPEFAVPDRKYLSRLASNYYENKKKILKDELEKINDVSLTTDCWTSKQNFSYISLTAHFIDSHI
jgi:hypothetical protein